MKEIKQFDPGRRDHFTGMYGAVMAVAGSAVGLGNIWRFPYIAGVYGGGAVILLYIVFVLLFGRPLMLAEMSLGRFGQGNPYTVFKRVGPNKVWRMLGSMCILAPFIILAYYTAIGGWTIEYMVKSVQHVFVGQSSEEISRIFGDFVADPVRPLVWQAVFLILSLLIVIHGVSKGIERYSRWMMPLLLLLLVVLCVRSVTLPGGVEGLKFLFIPDFDKINSESLLAALGQVFFSLSLGMGAIMTYGSYMHKEENIFQATKYITSADTFVSILASVAIFPAVFAAHLDPQSGAGLVFETLPNVFQRMPAGQLFQFMFFFLLLMAAITSAMSLLEVLAAYIAEELHVKRSIALPFAGVMVMILGVFASLSLGIMSDFKLLGRPVFDFLDYLSSNIILPLGGFFIALFFGFVLPKSVAMQELTSNGRYKVPDRLLFILIRYVAPAAVMIIFLNGIGLFDWF